MTTNNTPVIIVGAGPTGLTMASMLQRYGIDFVLLEKNAHVTSLSKAMVVHARSMEIFDELGLAETFLANGQITDRFNVMTNGKIAERVDLGKFGKGLTKFPFVLTIEQSKTEHILVDHLKSKGVEIQWSVRVKHIQHTPSGVKVDYVDARGNQQSINGQFLVGADGAGSLVRKSLGIDFRGNTEEKTFYVADVKLRSDLINKQEGYLNMTEEGFVLLFGLGGERHYRIIGVLPEAESAKNKLDFEPLKQTIKQQLRTPIVFEEAYWFSTYKVHSKIATAFQQGPCFLAGDASHIHTPAGGQGMNTGIQDAYNLGWKLAEVIKGRATKQLLESYSEERMANARHLLASTDRGFEFMMGNGYLIRFLKLHVFPYAMKLVTETGLGNQKAFKFLAQLSVAYPDSSLTIPSEVGGIHAGDRMPYFVTEEEQSVFDLLKGGGYKMLFFGPSQEMETLEDHGRTRRLIFEFVPELFHGEDDFYIYLRPDNHIVYIGSDLEIIKKLELERQFLKLRSL